jgi:hypothetical protein
MIRVELTVRRVVRFILVAVLSVAPLCASALIIASLTCGHGAPIGVNLGSSPMIYMPGMHAFAPPEEKRGQP